MRALVSMVPLLACSIHAWADRPEFEGLVKASLVFQSDFDANRRYPHVLKVFLRLESVSTSDVSWVTAGARSIEAELLGPDGNPVRHPPSAASISSSTRPVVLTPGSRLDWLISHGGVSMAEDAVNKYALIVGGKGWLIPIDSVGAFSLRVRLFGHRAAGVLPREKLGKPGLLLALPPTKIEIGK